MDFLSAVSAINLPLELMPPEIRAARLEVLVGCRQGGVQLFLLLVRGGAFVQVIVVHQIVIQTTTTTAACRWSI
jgi:hypothetical protein